MTQYTLFITFTSDLGFVVSVPQTIGPASPEALSLCIFVLNFNFGLPNLYSVFSFML
jgi:hypothetical protein